MVVITAIYVGATIAIWFANNKSARMTEKQLEESRSQFEEANRLECIPFMQLEIPTEQERPLFEIELDLCGGDITDTLYKMICHIRQQLSLLKLKECPKEEFKNIPFEIIEWIDRLERISNGEDDGIHK